MDTNMDTSADNPLGPESTPVVERVRHWYRGLPDKKRYLEFITAFLTIPVLLTVLLGNVSNLQNQKKTEVTPTPAPTTYATPRPTAPPPVISQSSSSTAAAVPASCTPGIGPIEITYPTENSTIDEDPVCLDIPRQSSNYCAVVWSYRINGGRWSEYTDREICMYSLAPGTKNLELKVKSISNGDERIIKRTFMMAGVSTPTPTATQSGNVNTP